jgi:hypothetical protein
MSVRDLSRLHKLLLTLVACAPSERAAIDATGTVEQKGDKLIVDVQTANHVSLEIEADPDVIAIHDRRSSGQKMHLELPALAYPVGPQKLKVKLREQDTTKTLELPFDRKPVEAKVSITKAPMDGGWGVACGGLGCESLNAKYGVVNFKLVGTHGTKVEVAGRPMRIGKDGTIAQLDMISRALDVVLADLPERKKGDDRWTTIPVKILADTSKTDELRLETSVFWRAVNNKARSILEGPINATGKPPGTPAASLVYAGIDLPESAVVLTMGAVTTLREVDLVAIAQPKPPREQGKCGPYTHTDPSKFEMDMVPHVLIDFEITVYERATGKVRAKKTFAPSGNNCPSTVVKGGQAREYPDLEVFSEWLGTFVK